MTALNIALFVVDLAVLWLLFKYLGAEQRPGECRICGMRCEVNDTLCEECAQRDAW